jgi:N-acyl-D-aspartate/D-glutamate deacylase
MMRPVLIKGGTLIDGSGAARREADVEIVDGLISQVGPPGSIALGKQEVIDARGCIVTPGFVDPHTHYDGHVTWENSLAPTSQHGVTTLLMGNCGVGFAPCRPSDREMLIELMEAIEDIPGPVLKMGLPWNWETFPEFLDSLAGRRYDADIATQIPHGALRVYVMGERALRRENSTPEDRAEMARLVAEAVSAGAMGFSSCRIAAHKTKSGNQTPDFMSPEGELTEIALAMKAVGRGVLQFVTDISDSGEAGVAEFAMLRRLVEKSGRSLSMNITQRETDPEGWRRMMRMIGEANNAGHLMRGQIMGRPIGLVLGFELTDNPFSGHPSYKAIAHLPFEERVRRLADPALRAKIISEQDVNPLHGKRVAHYERLYETGENADYEPLPDQSIAGRAKRERCSPAELAYDIMMKQGGRGMLYRALLNYAHGSLNDVYDMLSDPYGVPGIGDGGAHCGTTCDSSITTFNLAYWTRDRKLGPRLSLEKMVKGHTRDAAALIGLEDRGVVAPGKKADINVIDYDRLGIDPVRVVYDMPGGGRRLVQGAHGYVATLVSGIPTVRHDKLTGERPGRLLRR